MSRPLRLATWKTRSRSCPAAAGVGATDVGVAFLLRRQRRTALRAGGGHDEFAFGAIAQFDDGSQHLGDHVAGLADHHGVADQHALALDLRGVVQGGLSHRRPGHLHRRHERKRRDPPGAADVHPDVEQLGLRFLGRVLVGDGPARRPRRGTQPALQRHLVDFDHHAVDFVVHLVAVLAPVVDALAHTGQVGCQGGVFGNRQSPCPQRQVCLMQGGRAKALHVAQPVADHPQPAARGDRRVFLAQRSRRAVAGLANGALPSSTRLALSAWKSSSRKKTSPRTSRTSGTG